MIGRSSTRRLRQLTAIGAAGAVLAGQASAAAQTASDPLGTFVDESFRVPLVPEADTVVTDVELVDVDVDRDLDLFVTRGNLSGGLRTNQLFLNDGGGRFQRNPLDPGMPPGDYNDAEFGDVNGDGRLDVVLATTLTPLGLWFGHPVHARFVDKTGKLPQLAQPDVTVESRLFDADGDGDLDILTAVENPFGPGGQDRLFLNAGKGRFEEATANLPALPMQSSSSAVGDFDADGDSDVIAMNNGPFAYLVNDGHGRFDLTTDRLPSQASDRRSGRDALVADFDDDGDLDVMVAMSRADNGPLLWLNRGDGTFVDASDTNVPLAARGAQDLEACDLDGDGDLDVVEANTGAVLPPGSDHRFVGAAERLLVNAGNAVFSDVSADVLPDAAVDASFAVACGDIDADGDHDVIVANGKGEAMRVYVQTDAP